MSDVANVELGPVSEKTLFKAQSKNNLDQKRLVLEFMQKVVPQQLNFQKKYKKNYWSKKDIAWRFKVRSFI